MFSYVVLLYVKERSTLLWFNRNLLHTCLAVFRPMQKPSADFFIFPIFLILPLALIYSDVIKTSRILFLGRSYIWWRNNISFLSENQSFNHPIPLHGVVFEPLSNQSHNTLSFPPLADLIRRTIFLYCTSA